MLFNIFINDFVEYLQSDITEAVKLNEPSCNCLMYADDLLFLSESWEGLYRSDYGQIRKLLCTVEAKY